MIGSCARSPVMLIQILAQSKSRTITLVLDRSGWLVMRDPRNCLLLNAKLIVAEVGRLNSETLKQIIEAVSELLREGLQ